MVAGCDSEVVGGAAARNVAVSRHCGDVLEGFTLRHIGMDRQISNRILTRIHVCTDFRDGRKAKSLDYPKTAVAFDACGILYAMYDSAMAVKRDDDERCVARGILFGKLNNILLQTGFGRDGWIDPSMVTNQLKVRSPLNSSGYDMPWGLNRVDGGDLDRNGVLKRNFSVTHMPNTAFARGANTYRIEFYARRADEVPICAIIVSSLAHGQESVSIDSRARMQTNVNTSLDNLFADNPVLAQGTNACSFVKGTLKVNIESLGLLHASLLRKLSPSYTNWQPTKHSVADGTTGKVYRPHIIQKQHAECAPTRPAVQWLICSADETVEAVALRTAGAFWQDCKKCPTCDQPLSSCQCPCPGCGRTGFNNCRC